ncbi:MAG TPA: YebC/PmpR family DNA-binding transcriptional regulator [Symbiobacteriaceae bacterium]|nr:YebC/PmpR family DNA-binding transcriptional regulator [Symbiobacteriaceae bacterium]
MGRKWENIKRSKGKLDQERGAVFSRIAKDLMKAAKEGGPDPEANIRLKTAILAAREANMPNDNIQRAIRRGAGLEDGARYEDLVYEGYGPGGVAVMLNITTDNRNRTAGDVRFIFTKHGGALGETGCVGWMFTKRGVIEIDREQTKIGEDDLMMLVLEAGAEDLKTSEWVYEVFTAPESLDDVLRALESAKIPVASGAIAMVPNNTVEVAPEHEEKLAKMLDLLEEHDDVQNVYSNAVFAEEE